MDSTLGRKDSELRTNDSELCPMDAVPNETLVEILGLLPTKDLLIVRGVCRRWRDLAGSRAAWQHRDLEPGWPWLEAALRAAPCVRWLDTTFFGRDQLQSYSQLATTACEIQELLVDLDRSATIDLDVQVVLNQLDLGAVKRLIVCFPTSELEDTPCVPGC